MINGTGSFYNSEDDYFCKFVNGDEGAFRKLFELFYQPLCLYAKRYIDEQWICEDIVQDVFALLWRKRKEVDIKISIRSFLVVSVKNLCIDHLRKKMRMEQYRDLVSRKAIIFHPVSDDVYLLTELQFLLEKALQKLPQTYRTVFEMNRFEGKNFDEIANILDISIRTAKRYKSQVIETLKKELKDYLPLLLLLTVN